MKTNLWNSLELLSTQAALLLEWKQALGDDFAAGQVFLRPTLEQADSYPCAQQISCRCRHRVIFESDEDVSAVCDCDEGGCETMFLNPTDLIIHALNGEMLASAIRQAFHFDEFQSPLCKESRSYAVGSWGVRRSPVFFYVPVSENSFLSEIDRLSSAMPDPIVLLTPTPRFCTPMVQRGLRREGHAQMALAGVVDLIAPGQLEIVSAAKPTVEAVLGDFGKRITVGTPLERAIARVEEKLNVIAKSRTSEDNEAVSEQIARQAFAMVKQLETGPRRKNPTFATVFRLYCIEEMSSGQIAMRCGCSKAAIVDRLNVLAKRIGTPLAQLRRYSAQFERMESEMGDWRARRIDRRKLANESVEEESE